MESLQQKTQLQICKKQHKIQNKPKIQWHIQTKTKSLQTNKIKLENKKN